MSPFKQQLACARHRHHPATAPLASARCDREALVLDLSRALHLWPSQIDLASQAGRARVRATVRRALRTQRRHALAGHWAYDVACHARLLDLYRRVDAGCWRR